MKAFSHILLFLLIAHACSGHTNAPTQERAVHSLTNVSDSTWRGMATARAKKPVAVLTLTNDISQESVLAVTDRVNANHAIDGYVDGYCEFGARLCREYLGRGRLVRVSFAWDQRPRRTIVSLYCTNTTAAAAWRKDMTTALHQTFEDASVDYKSKE